MLVPTYSTPAQGSLVYIASEKSFVTRSEFVGDISSLQVNEVQLGVNEDCFLTSVWGYCPQDSWIYEPLIPPPAVHSVLKVQHYEMIPGVSVRVNRGERWPVSYDPASGWLCIRGSHLHSDKTYFYFSPGAIAAINEDQKLVELWLHPEFPV